MMPRISRSWTGPLATLNDLRAVHLQDINAEPQQLRETAIASAEIVECDPDAVFTRCLERRATFRGERLALRYLTDETTQIRVQIKFIDHAGDLARPSIAGGTLTLT